MYAIIATGGKQYKVSEGDIVKVEKLDVEDGSTVTFDQVLAVSDNGYKRKSGYHKKNGHRQAYTQVKIEKINA